MVQYSKLLDLPDAAVRERTIDGLLALRAGLAKDVSANNKDESFHLATWNIRDFGGHKLNPLPRCDEALLYIAEVISAFDLVAIQEVNQDMGEFLKMMTLLGHRWDYILTDQSGNTERLAFVYDRRKISFRHVAAEIVLPKKKGVEPPQFNRTPFLVAFQAGWFKFNLCTVHILYGDDKDTTARQREIADIASFFTTRQKQDGETYILLGDFNILSTDDPTMLALTENGFEVPHGLDMTTAVGSVHHYDQIALRAEKNIVQIVAANTFRWEDYVYRDADYETYKPLMLSKTGKPAKTTVAAYKTWRTWQMSDHQPLWAEIRTDFTDTYLDSLRAGKKAAANFDPATGPRASASGPVE